MARRIGIAFGGGAARGLAHIGVLRALRRHPAHLPTLVAGTSVGSIVAVLYAAGLPQEALERLAHGFDWLRNVVSFPETARTTVTRARHGGLVSNAALAKTINDMVGGRGFADLPLDVAVVAADLEHRRRVIFTSPSVASRLRRRDLDAYLAPPGEGLPGCETVVISDFPDVGLAVSASCAVPGVFVPVEVGGMRLVDGGVVDQVPVDVLRAMRATFAIGVSLALGYAPESINNPAAAVSGVIGILGQHCVRRSLDLADVGFQISGIETRSLVDIHQPELLERGEREAELYLEGTLWPRARMRPSRRRA